MDRLLSPGIRGALVLVAGAWLFAGCAGTPARDAGTAPPAAPVVATAGTDADADALIAGAAVADVQADRALPTTPEPGTIVLTPAPVPAGTSEAGADPRTAAEQDFDAIYGSPYDPVADPTLPAPVVMAGAYDPWEPFNRRVHRFNNAVDRTIAKPLAQAYVAVVPRPVRLGVTNFFNNLGQPVSALNALLQGRPGQAGASLGRFLVNSTVGVGGLFDPATKMKIPNRSEDFGQTLGIWGWKNSRYLELPLFGPRTVRDAFGLVGDAPLSPIRQVENDELRFFLQGLQLVDTRVQLMPLDSLRDGAADEYALFRDGWTQRRNYQIFGEGRRQDQDGSTPLPDYLLEDDYPTVPVDAMPVVVPLSLTP